MVPGAGLGDDAFDAGRRCPLTGPSARSTPSTRSTAPPLDRSTAPPATVPARRHDENTEVAVSTSTTPAPVRPPLRRDKDQGLLTGIAAGVANHLGVDVAIVRIVLVVATVLTNGLALLAYLAGLLFIPVATPEELPADRASVTSRGGSRDPWFWVGVALLVVGALWLLGSPFSAFGPFLRPDVLWPLVLIGFGLALWRAGDRRAAVADGPAGPTAAAYGSGVAPAGPGPYGATAAPGAPGGVAAPYGPSAGEPGHPGPTSAQAGGPGTPPPAFAPTSRIPVEPADARVAPATTGVDPTRPQDRPADAGGPRGADDPGATGYPRGTDAAGPVGPTGTAVLPGPGDGGTPPPPPPAPADGAGGGWTPPPAPTRRRSLLTRLTLGLALVAAGVVWLLGAVGVLAPTAGEVAAVALLVIGLGLLLGTVLGRGRGLVWVGLLLLPVVLVAELLRPYPVSVDQFRGPVGEIVTAPVDLAELRPSYQLAAGSLVLDLSELDPDELGTADDPTRVSVQIGAGEARIVVPDDVTVDVTARNGLGQVTLFGSSTGGIGTQRSTVRSGDGDGWLELDLQVGAGEVVVRSD
jgi:phage shock protein PspC (stress-responsive transcriptional regulator)